MSKNSAINPGDWVIAPLDKSPRRVEKVALVYTDDDKPYRVAKLAGSPVWFPIKMLKIWKKGTS